jgi:hypothetical protein
MHTAPNNRFAVLVLAFAIIILSAALAGAQGNGFHGSGFEGGGIAPRGVPASVTSIGFGGHPGFHGVPPSVTSIGFGGRPGFHGVPASVTSLGFGAQNGFRAPRGVRRPIHEEPFRFRRHHLFSGFYSPYYGGYYGYYPYPLNGDDYSQDDSAAYDGPAASDYGDHDYRDDDDRKTLEEDYRAGLNPPREQDSQPSPQPIVPQPSTVLIFKDGHQLEVANYAIVGATLYDLSDGRTKKIQLADLDVTATVKQNDQRGVEFQLPAAAQLN